MKNVSLFLLALVIGMTGFTQQTVQYRTIEERLNEEFCSGLFKTTDGTIIDVASNASAKAYLNILDWLDGRVSGLQVYKNRVGNSIPVLRGRVPGIYIDEMQVSASALSTLSIHDIAIVKVIKTPFYGGFNGGGGAIAIYTLGGEEEEDEGESK